MNNTEAHDEIQEFEVVIIGTGLTGLGLGIQLAREGKRSFVILERAGDVGGVWRDNTYPGVQCDVPSHLYSYSFRPNPHWTRDRASGAEIWEYTRVAAREENVLPHIRFHTTMIDARWNEEISRWDIFTDRGQYRAQFFAPAMGLLIDPELPPIPGLESFPGEMIHSGKWRDDVSLEGKRIAVVGTGASAVQLVPEVAKVASELVVFQRTAPWLLPRLNREFTEAEKRMYARDPRAIQALRSSIFWFTESTFAERRRLPDAIAATTAMANEFRNASIPDPELRAKLTPNYEIGCKRVLWADSYYPAFLRDNVKLETSALAQVDGSTLISADGNSFQVDVILFATGFKAYDPPFSHQIYGRNGLLLADKWSEGLQAYRTLKISGFPNLFVMCAPSAVTGHTSALFTIEAQIQHVMKALAWADDNQVEVFDVKREAEEAFAQDLHERGLGTVYLDGGCNSWYLDQRNGRLTLVWPDFAFRFLEEVTELDESAYIVTRRPAVA